MAERRLLRPERPGHVWAYDFVEDRTRDGRRFRVLCVVDEFTREALAIRVARKLGSADVIDTLADLFVARGVPAHVRSDQGPEFVAEAVKDWVQGVGAATAFIKKASPCTVPDLELLTLVLLLNRRNMPGIGQALQRAPLCLSDTSQSTPRGSC